MEHNTQENRKPGPIENLLLGSNWLLLPFYFLLISTLVPYLWKLSAEVFHLYSHFLTWDESELIISVLTIADITMISNLVMMIALGSYQIFVRQFSDSSSRPVWLNHISSGLLKIKMSTSLVGISSIHLLKDFVDAANTPSDIIVKHIALHVVFLLSTCALKFADKSMDAH